MKRQSASSNDGQIGSPRKKRDVAESAALLDAAIRAVTHASRIAISVQSRRRHGDAEVFGKSDKSPVTIADYAVQCLVTQYLSVATGVDSKLRLVAEEDTQLLKEGAKDSAVLEVMDILNEKYPFQEVARFFPEAASCGSFSAEDVLGLLQRGADPGGREGSFWVLDPIDGTKGFIRDAQYAIGLALVENGVPVLSAMACPNLPPPGGNVECRAEDAGFVFYASDSQASVLGLADCYAQLSGEAPGLGLEWHKLGNALGGSSSCPLKSAVLCESFESAHRGGDELLPQLAEKEVLTRDKVLRLDSMSKYGLVARGDAHVYLRGNFTSKRKECIWDHAPGWHIVTTAGGKVTDLNGKALDFGCGLNLSANTGVLATSSGVHEALLLEIAKLSGAVSTAPPEAKI